MHSEPCNWCELELMFMGNPATWTPDVCSTCWKHMLGNLRIKVSKREKMRIPSVPHPQWKPALGRAEMKCWGLWSSGDLTVINWDQLFFRNPQKYAIQAVLVWVDLTRAAQRMKNRFCIQLSSSGMIWVCLAWTVQNKMHITITRLFSSGFIWGGLSESYYQLLPNYVYTNYVHTNYIYITDYYWIHMNYCTKAQLQVLDMIIMGNWEGQTQELKFLTGCFRKISERRVCLITNKNAQSIRWCTRSVSSLQFSGPWFSSVVSVHAEWDLLSWEIEVAKHKS
jgi:hypothetical protein